MVQIEIEIPEDVANRLCERADRLGMTLPRYVAEIVGRDVGAGWPPRFFEEVVGGWKGAPLERPPQGELEARPRTFRHAHRAE
jgi:hypothetical protein